MNIAIDYFLMHWIKYIDSLMHIDFGSVYCVWCSGGWNLSFSIVGNLLKRSFLGFHIVVWLISMFCANKWWLVIRRLVAVSE